MEAKDLNLLLNVIDKRINSIIRDDKALHLYLGQLVKDGSGAPITRSFYGTSDDTVGYLVALYGTDYAAPITGPSEEQQAVFPAFRNFSGVTLNSSKKDVYIVTQGTNMTTGFIGFVK